MRMTINGMEYILLTKEKMNEINETLGKIAKQEIDNPIATMLINYARALLREDEENHCENCPYKKDGEK